jgi:hypothetical protein
VFQNKKKHFLSMTPYPPQKQVAVSQAATNQGNSVNTVKLINSQSSKNQLVFEVANASGAAVTDLALLPGVAGAQTLPANVTITPRGFASRAQMLAVLNNIKTQISGIRIETDDIANWDGKLTQTEIYPDGSTKSTELYLSDYKTQLGNDYSKTLRIPATDYQVVTWPGLSWVLSSLKAGTKMTFFCDVFGVDKLAELSAIPSKTI